MRNKTELIKRYSFFFLGILTNAFGVAFITRSLLGTGPTTCIPYVVSLKYTNFSYGSCNFIFNMILLVFQMIMLRKDFKLNQFLQIPVALLFSVLIDVAMALTAFIKADYYIVCLVYTVFGCVLRAFGVSCQVSADVVMLSTEAFVKAISDVTKKEFSICKLLCDAAMTIIAAVIALSLFGDWHEIFHIVREGTLITVLLVGPISHYFTRRLKFTNFIFENDGELVYETKFKLQKEKRLVITITSEGGSGGRIIARILGVLLGIPVYDKELVDMVVKESHLSKHFVHKHNEKLYSNIAEQFFMENYNFSEEDTQHYSDMFETQCRVIANLAETQDCIIIGHCSNYILKKFPGALHFLITADMEHRIEYISEKYRISQRKAIEKIETQDSDINDYYKHFTGNDWKDSSMYQMTIDSSVFGYEGTAELIEQIVKRHYIQVPSVKVKDLVSKYHIGEKTPTV